jgi:hypothetical protein
MTDVGKFNIITIIIYFVAYIILHIIIITMYKAKQKELENNINDEKIKKQILILKHLNRWFPALYTIFLIIRIAL